MTVSELIQQLRHLVLEHPAASNLPVTLTDFEMEADSVSYFDGWVRINVDRSMVECVEQRAGDEVV